MKTESDLEIKVKRLAEMQPAEKEEFFGEYIREKNGSVKVKVNKLMHDTDFEEMVRYAWEHEWKSELRIPELVGVVEILDILGKGVYTALGIKHGRSKVLLKECITGYGKINDEKARVFIKEKSTGKRVTLANAFFTGDEKEENAKKLVVYAWKHKWRKELRIPELVEIEETIDTLGIGTYRALRIRDGNRNELLKECIV